MRDLKLSLEREYRRDDDASQVAPQIVSLNCKFDDPYKALRFAHDLNELCSQYMLDEQGSA